ncbi:MAG: hypothetical protein R8M11_02990 [Gallionella sp.]
MNMIRYISGAVAVLGMTILLGNGAAVAVAESDDYEVWVEGVMQDGMMVVSATAVAEKDATVTYELIAEKKSAGGIKARTRQSGKVILKTGVEKELCVLKIDKDQAARHYFMVKIYSGKTIVAEASTKY